MKSGPSAYPNGIRRGIMEKILQSLQSKDGTSMVEVLTAFLVIVLMITMFGKVVTLSMGILQRSQKVMENMETFNSEYYQEKNKEKQTLISGRLSLKEDWKNPSEGTVIPLSQGELKKYTDDTTGLSRYFIEVMPQTENGEGKDEMDGQ